MRLSMVSGVSTLHTLPSVDVPRGAHHAAQAAHHQRTPDRRQCAPLLIRRPGTPLNPEGATYSPHSPRRCFGPTSGCNACPRLRGQRGRLGRWGDSPRCGRRQQRQPVGQGIEEDSRADVLRNHGGPRSTAHSPTHRTTGTGECWEQLVCGCGEQSSEFRRRRLLAKAAQKADYDVEAAAGGGGGAYQRQRSVSRMSPTTLSRPAPRKMNSGVRASCRGPAGTGAAVCQSAQLRQPAAQHPVVKHMIHRWCCTNKLVNPAALNDRL